MPFPIPPIGSWWMWFDIVVACVSVQSHPFHIRYFDQRSDYLYRHWLVGLAVPLHCPTFSRHHVTCHRFLSPLICPWRAYQNVVFGRWWECWCWLNNLHTGKEGKNSTKLLFFRIIFFSNMNNWLNQCNLMFIFFIHSKKMSIWWIYWIVIACQL